MPEKTINEIIDLVSEDTPGEEETQEDQSEPTEEETEETNPEEEESADAEEDSEEDDPLDEDEPDDSPLIDERIKDALKDNPEALRILERQEKGFRKAIEENRELRPLGDINTALRNPDTAFGLMKTIIEQNAQAWGYSDVNDYLAKCWGDNPEPTEDARYEMLQREIAEMKRAQEEDRKAREEKDYVARVAKKTIKQAASELNGFAVTPNMVAAALKDYPQHRNDPLRAVKAKYTDQIIAHRTKVATGLKAAGHTLPDSIKGKGQQAVKDIRKLSLDETIDMLSNG